MNLYNKYRPQTVVDMIGDFQYVIDMVDNGVNVFLFTGTSGAGKTTLAHIIAKHVSADNPLACKHLNVSDKNSVDDVRGLIDLMRFRGKSVLILDEVHRYSAQAWDAFLIPLEFAKDNKIVILCTTEPRKIPKTIINRCKVVNFPPISEDSLFVLVADVAAKEGVQLANSTLLKIAQSADGCAREALNLLETVLANNEENVDVLLANYVQEDSTDMLVLCRAVYSKKWDTARKELAKLTKNDYEAVRMALLSYGSKMLLNGAQNLPIKYFISNLYDSGLPGLVYQCYLACGGN